MRTTRFLVVAICFLAGCDRTDSTATENTAADTTRPVIKLVGDNPQHIEQGGPYFELGARAWDDVDGDLSDAIRTDASDLDTTVAASYEVFYDVSDSSGNDASTAVRGVVVEEPPADASNLAAAFGWRQFADTDLQLSEFHAQDFTIALRVMLQYPRAHIGPLVAATGGGLELSKQSDSNTLSARFGAIKYNYPSGKLQRGDWHHIAVARRDGLVTLYIDGQLICPVVADGCAAGAGAAFGLLRIGRAGEDPLSGSSESQHYGFIDDLAVYALALSPTELQRLSEKDRLDGAEPGLYAGWTFDELLPSGDLLPPALQRGLTYYRFTGSASEVSSVPFVSQVSENRDSERDAAHLPLPANHAPMRLPFLPGEAWLVTQGWEDSLSHHGRAAFAWDFQLAGVPVSETEGRAFHAVAPGTVVELEDGRTSCSGSPANHVDVNQAPGEHSVYLHHVINSAAVAVGDYVLTGDYLADTGDTGNAGCDAFHLHFALHNLPESERNYLVTIPGAFDNYEVSRDEGDSWSPLASGVPKHGEWVRNPHE